MASTLRRSTASALLMIGLILASSSPYAQTDTESAAADLSEASAHFDEAERLFGAGSYASAEREASNGLAACPQLAAPECAARGEALLGDIYRSQGRNVEAEARYRSALRAFDAVLEREPQVLVRALEGLEVLFEGAFRVGDLVPVYEQRLAVREHTLEEGHPLISQAVEELAEAYVTAQEWGGLENLMAAHEDHPIVEEYAQILAAVHLMAEQDRGAYGRVKDAHPEQFGEEASGLDAMGALMEAYQSLSPDELAWVTAETDHLRAGGQEVDTEVALDAIAELRASPEASEGVRAYLDALADVVRMQQDGEAALEEPEAPGEAALLPEATTERERPPSSYGEFTPPDGEMSEALYGIYGVSSAEEFAQMMGEIQGLMVMESVDVLVERARRGDDRALEQLLQAARAATTLDRLQRRLASAMGTQLGEGMELPFQGGMNVSSPLLRDGLFELAAERPEDRRLAAALLRMVMNAKGRSLDRDASLYAPSTPRASEAEGVGREAALVDSLRLLSQQISTLTNARPAAGENSEAHELQLAILHERRLRVSAALRQLRPLPSMRPVETEQVLASLAPGHALVELTVTRRQPVPGERLGEGGSYRYAAFVARPEGVRYHALGDGEEVDELILDARDLMEQYASGYDRRAADEELRPVLARLHEILVAPLGLRADEAVYVAPEGLLSLLPFEILVDEEGGYLLDRHRVAYLTSGRDLLDHRSEPAASDGDFVVFADPDYGAEAAELAAAPPTDRLGGSQATRSEDLGSTGFERLRGTAAEARTIVSLFGEDEVSVYTDARASEQNLMRLASPWRLHIATHGFFLADVPDPEDPFAMSAFRQRPQEGLVDRFESPLLRSGLALAGANTGGSVDGRYDGVLTAFEVAAADLQGTDLVVLSACETGVGEVRTGDGVHGLRRAFQLAGARSLVMSMWRVSDEATNLLMSELYGRLKEGTPKGEALREAALALRRDEAYSHPYYWGAFVLVGEPR